MAKFRRGNLDLNTNQKIRLGTSLESYINYDGSKLEVSNTGQVDISGGHLTIGDLASFNESQNQIIYGPLTYPGYDTTYFDNTYWTPDTYGTWTGSGWLATIEPNEYIVQLEPLGGWEVGFRPTKMRLTWTEGQDPISLVRLRDTDGNFIVNLTSYSYNMGDDITINWQGFDIDYIYVSAYPNVSFTLTSIGFYDEAVTSTTGISYDSTNYEATMNLDIINADTINVGGTTIDSDGISGSSTLTVGLDDSQPGSVYVYGGGESADGGKVRVYVNAGVDNTIDYYSIEAVDWHLDIGPDTNPDALRYDGFNDLWIMTADAGLEVSASGNKRLDIENIKQVIGDLTDTYVEVSQLDGETGAYLNIGRSGSDVISLTTSGTVTAATTWNFTSGAVNVGQSDSVRGAISLYGDSNKTQGALVIYNAANADGTVNSYTFGNNSQTDGNLYIGPNTDFDSLSYVVSSNTWEFRGGLVKIGEEDSQQGILYVYGNNGKTGGVINVYLGDTYDGTIDYYSFRVGTNSDDLHIGPSTDPDALKYDGNDNSWYVTNGSWFVGLEHLQDGRLRLYGDNNKNQGSLTIYNGANADGTVDYYVFGGNTSSNGDLLIGPNTDTDALKYDVAAGVWQFTRTETRFGTEGATGSGALLTLYGRIADDGGEIHLHNADDADSNIAHYSFHADRADLDIGPNTDDDALKYQESTNKWIMSASGGTEINSLTVTSGIANLGVDDNTRGVASLYGSNGADGGVLRIYNGDGYDGTTNYYEIQAGNGISNGYLFIGPNTDLDSIYYNDSNLTWTFSAGLLNLGSDDLVRSQLSLFGSSSKNGATLRLYNGATYDDTVDYYQMSAGNDSNNGNLQIGPVTDLDALIYEVSTNRWVFSSTGGTEINSLTVNSKKVSGQATTYVYGDASVTDGDVALVDSTSVATISLTEASDAVITVKSIGTANVVVQGLTGQIDGVASKTLTARWQSITAICDGTDWFIISQV